MNITIMQFENLVDGLIEGAANSFNFNDNSFLPEEARSALNDFVGANVDSVNISGTRNDVLRDIIYQYCVNLRCTKFEDRRTGVWLMRVTVLSFMWM